MSEQAVPDGSDERAVHGPATAALSRRLESLLAVLDAARVRLDPAVVERVEESLARVRERLAIGVDQTVVAIVGGTGSGKSSLFNAATRLSFARVSTQRPTTTLATACVWGQDGDALMDWLGVDRHRHMQRESVLDADDELALRGLVLLDLPDHDSIEPEHRAIVDTVLPFADLVLWVVDPQKYADDALHTGYLRALAGHEGSTVVVLNQIDTVPADQRDVLAADVAALLVADGLQGVRVLLTSARTGEGVADVRRLLADAVARRSLATTHAAEAVEVAASSLITALGPALPAAPALTEVVDLLGRAGGLDAVADTVEASLRAGAASRAQFGPVQADEVALARAGWLRTTTATLAPRWAKALDERVATADELRLAVADALSGVSVAVARPVPGRAGVVVGGLLVALGALAAVLGAALDAAPGWLLPAGAGAAVAGVLLAGVALWTWRGSARRQSARVRRQGRAALSAVAQARLAEPYAAVADEHRRLLAALDSTSH